MHGNTPHLAIASRWVTHGRGPVPLSRRRRRRIGHPARPGARARRVERLLAAHPAPARHRPPRLRAPDLPGFGRTTRPPRPLAIDALARALGEWLDALDVAGPVHLVGHSMGGQVWSPPSPAPIPRGCPGWSSWHRPSVHRVPRHPPDARPAAQRALRVPLPAAGRAAGLPARRPTPHPAHRPAGRRRGHGRDRRAAGGRAPDHPGGPGSGRPAAGHTTPPTGRAGRAVHRDTRCGACGALESEPGGRGRRDGFLGVAGCGDGAAPVATEPYLAISHRGIAGCATLRARERTAVVIRRVPDEDK